MERGKREGMGGMKIWKELKPANSSSHNSPHTMAAFSCCWIHAQIGSLSLHSYRPQTELSIQSEAVNSPLNSASQNYAKFPRTQAVKWRESNKTRARLFVRKKEISAKHRSRNGEENRKVGKKKRKRGDKEVKSWREWQELGSETKAERQYRILVLLLLLEGRGKKWDRDRPVEVKVSHIDWWCNMGECYRSTNEKRRIVDQWKRRNS